MSGTATHSLLRNTGLGGKTLESILSRELKRSSPEALGVAVAYLSIYGARFLRRLASDLRITNVRLVADTGDAITHPEALRLALDQGWSVKAANPMVGTFHPKMMVGGKRFSESAGIETPTWMIVGSGNLSKGGLVSNVETSLIRYSAELSPRSGIAFKELWDVGNPLTSAGLSDYAKYFADHNRHRSPKDLTILGIADEPLVDMEEVRVSQRRAPGREERSIGNEVASAAWAGLESFTGEYTLQVEFPRDAGDVLRRIIGGSGATPFVGLLCEDGHVRQMRFRYYHDNSMFRLNVPNEVPRVPWVRANKAGLALVEQGDSDGHLTFRILPPSNEMNIIIARSVALGTWGRTPTRLYGWY